MNNCYYFDLFKLPLFLHIDRREKNSTIIGQFLSILAFLFLIFSFQQSDVFQHKRPIIIDQPKTLKFRPNIKIDSKNFALSSAVTDEKSRAINDPTAFSINIYYERLESVGNQTGKTLTYFENKVLHKCNDSDFPEDPMMLTDMGLENYLCMDNSTLDFGGYWDQPIMTYFFAVLSVCTNRSDSNITCKTPEEIKKLLVGTYFTIYYKDINYDMNDYDNPVKVLYKTDYFFLDLVLRKKLTITYKKVEITDDKSWLGNNEIVKDYFKRESSTSDFDTNADSASQIAAFIFYPSDEVQIVSRRFQTFGEACANLGGVASFIMIVGSAFVKIFNETSVVNKIMNQLYSFQPIETDNKKKEKKIKKNRFLNFKNFMGNPQDIQIKPNLSISKRENSDKNITNEGKGGPQNYIDSSHQLNELSIKKVDSSKDEKSSKRNDSEGEKFSLEKLIKSNRSKGHSIFDLNRHSRRKQKAKLDFSDIKNFKEWAAMHQKKQKVTMSIFEFLKMLVVETFHLNMSPKEKMMSEAQKIFAEEMDVITILKKLQDVEKLKRIVLNDKQLSLFNFIAKPMIYHNFESESNRSIQNLRRISTSFSKNSSSPKINEIHDSQKILQIYQDLKNSENLEEIDKRLMKLIDRNFETFVENLKRTSH